MRVEAIRAPVEQKGDTMPTPLRKPGPASHTAVAAPSLASHTARVLGQIALWVLLALASVQTPAQTQYNYVVAAPITPNSDGDPVLHTLQATWDTSVLQILDMTSIAYPQGWTLKYQANGIWSTTPPTKMKTISGLRASGTFISAGAGVNGTQSGQQLIVGTTQVLVPATPGTFAVPTNGDGWNVFFDASNTQVFNIYHHSNPAKIDCHQRVNGATCSGWPNGGSAVPGGTTAYRATGIALKDGRIFIPGGNGQFGGFSCVTTSGKTCPTPFYALTAANAYTSYDIVDLAYAHQKLYTWDAKANQLLCFDPTLNTACAGENRWTPTGFANQLGNSVMTVRLLGDNNFVYGYFRTTAGGAYMYCYDATLNATCANWSTINPIKFSPQLLIPISKNGTDIDSVCAYLSSTNYQCLRSNGAAIQPPKPLFSSLNITSDIASVWDNSAISMGRSYWAGDYGYGQIGCYDAVNDKNCWTTPIYYAYPADIYTVTPDPAIPNCIWTNSDGHGIKTWDASGSTMKENCAGIPPTVVFSADSSNLRLACPSDHSLSTWISYQISGATGASSATLTVLDSSGNTIPGWTNVPAGNGGKSRALAGGNASWDLSALTIAQTGQSPKFKVVLPGTAGNTPVTASITVAGNPPELCWSAYTKPQPSDPTNPNVNPNPDPNSLISILIDGVNPNASNTPPGNSITTPPKSQSAPTVKRQTWIQLR